ncbi:MAG: hypothetical protein AAF730_11100 [Bacteroidota bacterium]
MTIRTFSLSALTVPLLLFVGLPFIVLTLLWLDVPVHTLSEQPISLVFILPVAAVYVGVSLQIDVKRKLPDVQLAYRELITPLLIAICPTGLVLGMLWVDGRLGNTATLVTVMIVGHVSHRVGRWWLIRRLEAATEPAVD